MNADEWLVTYSDVITLLMAFFVMMFSVSKVDPANFEMIKTAMTEHVAKMPVTKPFNTLFDNMKQELAEGEAKNQVKVRRIPRGILLEFTSAVMFDPGSATLRPEVLPTIKKFAGDIKGLSVKSYNVVIEGHTDSDGSREYNQKLSEVRSTMVREGLVQSYEFITQGMVESIGYGEEHPIVENISPENKALNRRIEIIVWE